MKQTDQSDSPSARIALLKKNKLLSKLPEKDFARMSAAMEIMSTEIRDMLCEASEPMSHIYFPINTVSSIIIDTLEGLAVEVVTIGKEGMVGLPVFLGGDTMPATIFTQVAGTIARMTIKDFRRELGRSEALNEILRRYTQTMLMFTSQSTACNRLHAIEQRCARWLLHTHDRIDGDSFMLTQEFLAQMLGVRRPSVTVVAAVLQRAGAIKYSRGHIEVCDRGLLEASSCECYGRISDEYRRLFPVGRRRANSKA